MLISYTKSVLYKSHASVNLVATMFSHGSVSGLYAPSSGEFTLGSDPSATNTPSGQSSEFHDSTQNVCCKFSDNGTAWMRKTFCSRAITKRASVSDCEPFGVRRRTHYEFVRSYIQSSLCSYSCELSLACVISPWRFDEESYRSDMTNVLFALYRNISNSQGFVNNKIG